jgi:serine/threonine-protein kinase
MFLAEGRILQRLRHPNIVQVYELVEAGGSMLLVLEHLDGVDLRRILRGAPDRGGSSGSAGRGAGGPLNDARVPLSVTLAIGCALASALAYAHAQTDADGRPLELIHRDVSPANVIITFDGAVKLIDFGIALSIDREALTKTGFIKGNPLYMSPEQTQGLPLDRRSDVYSLGVMLYELTTGVHPFRGGERHVLARGAVAPPRQLRPGYPAPLEAIVLKAMAASPDERYPGAGALHDELVAFAGGTGLLATRATLAAMAAKVADRPTPEASSISETHPKNAPAPFVLTEFNLESSAVSAVTGGATRIRNAGDTPPPTQSFALPRWTIAVPAVAAIALVAALASVLPDPPSRAAPRPRVPQPRPVLEELAAPMPESSRTVPDVEPEAAEPEPPPKPAPRPEVRPARPDSTVRAALKRRALRRRARPRPAPMAPPAHASGWHRDSPTPPSMRHSE